MCVRVLRDALAIVNVEDGLYYLVDFQTIEAQLLQSVNIFDLE